MNVLPVIVREVRVQARQKFTYTLRMLGAAAVLGALAFCALTRHGLTRAREASSFTSTAHCFGRFGSIPAEPADCVSRERRSGVVPEPDGIVLRKVRAGLRALTLWLAALRSSAGGGAVAKRRAVMRH
jgi:hypothetical protein